MLGARQISERLGYPVGNGKLTWMRGVPQVRREGCNVPRGAAGSLFGAGSIRRVLRQSAHRNERHTRATLRGPSYGSTDRIPSPASRACDGDQGGGRGPQPEL